jgi:hypothetical protein
MVLAAIIGLLLGMLGEFRLAVGAAVATLCLTLSFKYPRQALFAFIVYLPFSGTVTYALGGGSILQLAKDAIYIPALIGVWQFCRKTQQPLIVPRAIQAPLLLLLILLGLTLLLVNGPQQLQAQGENSLLIGILGLKVLLGYLPVIACIYYLIRNRQDLYLLLRIQVVLVIICCALGLVQYLMLRTGLCAGTVDCVAEECFKASLEARCLVGGSLLYQPTYGQIRLPGTFVAPWQWGWFLIASSFFSFGTAFSDRNPFWRLMGLISLAAILVMAVVSGQRIALMLVPLTITGLLLLTGQIANLKRFIPAGLALGLILTVLLQQQPELVATRWQSFVDRWQAAPPHVFIAQQFAWAQEQQQGILGQGIGRGTNAARIFGQVELVETYHPKLLFEIGPLGLLAVLLLYGTLSYATFKAYRRIHSPDLRGYGASMFMFVVFISFFPYYYPLDVDPVNVYYWLAAGIALKIPEIEQQEQLQQKRDESGGKGLSRCDRKRLKAQERTVTFD